MENSITQDYAPKDNNGHVSVKDLAAAIREAKPQGQSMDEEESYAMAEHISNFFGYEDRIIDNALLPEDRDIFYILEDAGLLTTDREDTVLYDGRDWHIHYWLQKKAKIKQLAERHWERIAAKEPKKEHPFSYEEVLEDIWASRKGPQPTNL